jgi:hypothetical protein
MNIEPGLVVVIVCMAIFYVRVLLLRREKKRKEMEAVTHAMRKGKERGKQAALPPKDPNAPPFAVTSWPLVVVGIILMLAGVVSRDSTTFPELMVQYWWVLTSLGVLAFTFCFKL